MFKRGLAVLAAAVLTVACAQTDAGITTSVESALAADDAVSAYELDVDTEGGVVTLSGTVETAAEKQQALMIARQTDGVQDVIDQVRVGETAATSGEFDLDAPDVDLPDVDAPDVDIPDVDVDADVDVNERR